MSQKGPFLPHVTSPWWNRTVLEIHVNADLTWGDVLQGAIALVLICLFVIGFSFVVISTTWANCMNWRATRIVAREHARRRALELKEHIAEHQEELAHLHKRAHVKLSSDEVEDV